MEDSSRLLQLPLDEILNPRPDPRPDDGPRLGLVLLHGSWNEMGLLGEGFLERLYAATVVANYSSDHRFLAHVLVDESDESVELLLGETKNSNNNNEKDLPLPPGGELPALAFVWQTEEKVVLRYIPCSVSDLMRAVHTQQRQEQSSNHNTNNNIAFAQVLRPARNTLEQLQDDFAELMVEEEQNSEFDASSSALRIFIAGDRSSVGKSSVCLGLLGNLLAAGYAPERLAYIKPATQSESTQLIQLFCEQQGIHCRPVGPLVYYRGFTRAYLAGETESTATLLADCGRAVDRIARGKQVVLIDGVGFPAVGSICGTSNAAVAGACGYPVVQEEKRRRPVGVCLVGGSGVGAAVDAFNLNATYFEQAGIPVLGAIFNKLSETGFYSLENCRTQVTSYFDQNEEQIEKGHRPFGFLPLFPKIAGKNALQYVDEYFRIFGQNVDVKAILEAATRIKQNEQVQSVIEPTSGERVVKRQKLAGPKRLPRPLRSRKEIESVAINMGAAPSA